MVEESDKSDSWGSLLINGILNKLSLVSEKKSEIHTGDQDKHPKMIIPKRQDTSKEVAEKMVTKKVHDRPNSNKIEDKDTSDQFKKNTKTEDMFKARLLNGYSNPECQSYAIKNKNKAKDTKGKSLLNNDHNSVETIHVQSSDFMEEKNDEKQIEIIHKPRLKML